MLLSVEDLHQSLQCPQLEAEDEAVIDEEVVAKGESPLVPGEDGTVAGAKDDVHRPD
jgi:hypothetical protein